jgi:glycosyltransferase involved in cell wall biosynthesis
MPLAIHNEMPTPRDAGLQVWQVCESFAAPFGGISATSAQLTNRLARSGAQVVAISLDQAGDRRPRWPLDPAVDDVRGAAAWPARIGYSGQLGDRFASLPAPDVVHIQGLWRVHFAQAAGFARRQGVPVIVTVHGMLHRPALRQRALLKRLGRVVFQDEVFRTAHCLHATAEAEADEIRSLGIDRPIAIVPWGVDIPECDAADGRQSESPDRPRVVLFLGRLHPTKGLDTLLRAWARIFARFPSWRLVLAGYDAGHYAATLQALAGELGLGDSLRITGPVDGSERDRLLGSADLLVLPSPSENFGLVVPEALVRGVPVIATYGSPWASLQAQDCGWWIPIGEDALAAALTDALGRPAAELHAMGERGRDFARRRFAWQAVTTSMLDLYAWVRGLSPMPSFVQQ